MIACYAWSNMMILNAMNIKINYYPDEDMDLFIRMTPGISRDLLGIVKSQKIFSSVSYTSVPNIKLLGRIKKKLKLEWVNYYRKYHGQYNRLLFNLVGNKKYDIFLTAGFWNDSLYYIDYFFKNNHNLKIILYDEGGASYDNPKRNLCRYYCNKNITPWKSRIKRFTTEKIMELRYMHLVQNYIYLYSPERYLKMDSKITVKRIPFIDDKNEKIHNLLHENMMSIYEQDLLPYERRGVYFISSSNSNWLPDCEKQSCIMIDALIENVNGHNIIIKTHPNNTNNRLSFAKEYEKKVFVDRGNVLLEFIYPNVDIENKLIITYASSSAMYAKIMFNKEPYIVLIFRLYHQYHENGDINAEQYAEDMKELYQDKSKIYIPNTIDEYIENIKEIQRKIVKYA